MNRTALGCILCLALLIGSAGSACAFTVSISNYGCVYSGWEEAYYVDSNGDLQRWHWEGTAVDRIPENYGNWYGTNCGTTLTCQVNVSVGLDITNSEQSVPAGSYFWLHGYDWHVIDSYITFHAFSFDLTWTGFPTGWYMWVTSTPYIGGHVDVPNSTSCWTKRIIGMGSYHVTGDLMGVGAPVIVLSHFPPTTVPEPSSILALLTGLAGIGGMVIRRKK